MWHEYSGGARRPCARARSPPGSRRVRDRAAALDDRGAAGVLAARLRAGVTSFPIAPAALHRHHEELDAVLARPQSSVSRLPPAGSLAKRRRPSRRDRARPHMHLLGRTLTRRYDARGRGNSGSSNCWAVCTTMRGSAGRRGGSSTADLSTQSRLLALAIAPWAARKGIDQRHLPTGSAVDHTRGRGRAKR